MTRHRLAPLLAPESIAFVGASRRPNTPGNDMLVTLARSGFRGRVHAINPRYREVLGHPCLPSLEALEAPVDLAVLAVPNAALEKALGEAIAVGARAAVIFASGHLDEPGDSRVIERLAAMARAADMPVCGVNCMGFYNDELPVWVCGFPSLRTRNPGGITFIAQSGSVFGALAHNDARFSLNLLVSSGQELVTTAADYLDYALARESTRVVGLFLETIRDPDGFCRALARARDREIPIVALKVGRTERSRAMALSHTGAMTGDDGAFDALCEHYGVARVASLDELAATLLLFGSGRRAAPGGLVTIHDSGGEREMLADLATEIDIPFAALAPDTRARLEARLEPGLEADNPLDAWGTGRDFEAIFTDCLQALVEDPGAALGMLFADIRDGYYVSEGYAAAAAAVAARTAKPVALATNFSGVRHDGLAARLTRAGVPVLDGTAEALCAARHLLSHRDLLARTHAPAPPPPAGARARWETALRAGRPLDESTSLALLADYGLEAAPSRIVEGEAEAVAALQALGRPVALKTAAAGILHKSDRAGVHLGLRDETELVAAYREFAERLGPRALVQRMAPAGVELVFGARIDAQFGPVVIIGGGGVWIEVLRDVAYGLAPLASDAARRLIGRLRVRPLLEGARGRRPADLDRLVEALVRFSVMVADLRDLLAEVDVNPVIAGAEGTLAVDALIVPAKGGDQDGAEP